MFLDETFNLESFNELDPITLDKLARVEEVEVSMKYKRTYAFDKYSKRQLHDNRTLNKIERIIAPHGDILLSNMKSIAEMTEQGLVRTRLADLYYDLSWKERKKEYKKKCPEISKSQIIQNIISKDIFTSYAIPESYMKETNSFIEDYTFTTFTVHWTGLLNDLKIEWKYLDKQDMTIIEKCRLIAKSRLCKYTGGLGCEAIIPLDGVVDRKVLKYYNDYIYSFLYYVQEYGYIPEKIYLELPDKFETFNLSEEEFDTITKLQNFYPRDLDHESSKNLDYFLRHHEVNIDDTISLYKKLTNILLELRELKNYRLFIQKTTEIDELFMIVATEPKEYSEETNDISDFEREEISKQIKIIADQKIDVNLEEIEILDENCSDLEFIYDVNDNESLGSDYDYGDMDTELLYWT
jgi:hypothetical protein